MYLRDILLPCITIILLVVAWCLFFDFKAIQPANQTFQYYLYQSIFQGFSAFVALILAFVAFALLRGEQRTFDWGQMMLKELRTLFKGVEIHDASEARIWIHLWDSILPELAQRSPNEGYLIERSKRILGKYLHENDIMISLPIRTTLVLFPFVLLILCTLFLQAEVISGSEWTALVVLGSAFSVSYVFVFAWRVLSAISTQDQRLYEAKAALNPHEKRILEEDEHIDIDHQNAIGIMHFINFDHPDRKG